MWLILNGALWKKKGAEMKLCFGVKNSEKSCADKACFDIDVVHISITSW
jgi:hypothetical protein